MVVFFGWVRSGLGWRGAELYGAASHCQAPAEMWLRGELCVPALDNEPPAAPGRPSGGQAWGPALGAPRLATPALVAGRVSFPRLWGMVAAGVGAVLFSLDRVMKVGLVGGIVGGVGIGGRG